jgi:hypothetical protein
MLFSGERSHIYYHFLPTPSASSDVCVSEKLSLQNTEFLLSSHGYNIARLMSDETVDRPLLLFEREFNYVSIPYTFI